MRLQRKAFSVSMAEAAPHQKGRDDSCVLCKCPFAGDSKVSEMPLACAGPTAFSIAPSAKRVVGSEKKDAKNAVSEVASFWRAPKCERVASLRFVAYAAMKNCGHKVCYPCAVTHGAASLVVDANGKPLEADLFATVYCPKCYAHSTLDCILTSTLSGRGREQVLASRNVNNTRRTWTPSGMKYFAVAYTDPFGVLSPRASGCAASPLAADTESKGKTFNDHGRLITGRVATVEDLIARLKARSAMSEAKNKASTRPPQAESATVEDSTNLSANRRDRHCFFAADVCDTPSKRKPHGNGNGDGDGSTTPFSTPGGLSKPSSSPNIDAMDRINNVDETDAKGSNAVRSTQLDDSIRVLRTDCQERAACVNAAPPFTYDTLGLEEALVDMIDVSASSIATSTLLASASIGTRNDHPFLPCERGDGRYDNDNAVPSAPHRCHHDASCQTGALCFIPQAIPAHIAGVEATTTTEDTTAGDPLATIPVVDLSEFDQPVQTPSPRPLTDDARVSPRLGSGTSTSPSLPPSCVGSPRRDMSTALENNTRLRRLSMTGPNAMSSGPQHSPNALETSLPTTPALSARRSSCTIYQSIEDSATPRGMGSHNHNNASLLGRSPRAASLGFPTAIVTEDMQLLPELSLPVAVATVEVMMLSGDACACDPPVEGAPVADSSVSSPCASPRIEAPAAIDEVAETAKGVGGLASPCSPTRATSAPFESTESPINCPPIPQFLERVPSSTYIPARRLSQIVDSADCRLPEEAIVGLLQDAEKAKACHDRNAHRRLVVAAACSVMGQTPLHSSMTSRTNSNLSNGSRVATRRSSSLGSTVRDCGDSVDQPIPLRSSAAKTTVPPSPVSMPSRKGNRGGFDPYYLSSIPTTSAAYSRTGSGHLVCSKGIFDPDTNTATGSTNAMPFLGQQGRLSRAVSRADSMAPSEHVPPIMNNDSFASATTFGTRPGVQMPTGPASSPRTTRAAELRAAAQRLKAAKGASPSSPPSHKGKK